jgi:hypothetical protein
MPQLNLNFIDIPLPQESLWAELNNEQRLLIVESLARLVLKAVATTGTATPAKAPEEAAND